MFVRLSNLLSFAFINAVILVYDCFAQQNRNISDFCHITDIIKFSLSLNNDIAFSNRISHIYHKLLLV